ncbi:MAG: PsiF family protein [Alphaproteobacteria bacterium]
MKTATTALFLAAVLAAPLAAHGANAQNEVMKTCNAKASETGLSGAERKKYMSTCLSSARNAQQKKMKQCNIEATGKAGDERKAFMKGCLSAN